MFIRRLILLLLCVNHTWAHPDRIEDRLLFHFATGAHPPVDGAWPDLTHRAKAVVRGAPVLKSLGPALALHLDGAADWLQVAGSLEDARSLLPERECSVTAWVWLDETRRDGGVCGLVQDNGSYEKGWVLGYDGDRFSWALSGRRAGEADGGLTFLRSRTPVGKSRWHHIAGTYDGAVMRLYVDGELNASGTNQCRVCGPHPQLRTHMADSAIGHSSAERRALHRYRRRRRRA